MNDHAHELRRRVADEYTEALGAAACGCACCGRDDDRDERRGSAYAGADVGSVPAEVVATSFGCANPLAHGALAAGDVVLDLGCGAGLDLLLAARRVGPRGRVIGVDMTEAMVRRAEANTAGLTNVEVRRGLIEDLPVADASVDWVVSNCVINLSPEKERVFAEIARVLRPAGRFRIADLVADRLPEILRNDAALYSCCIGGAIGEADYLEGLRRAGLRDVAVVERVVYDRDRVEALFRAAADGAAPGCGSLTPSEIAACAEELDGRIASVVVIGER